jgi:hypothetical protein
MMRRSRLRVPMLEFLSGNQRQSLARDSIGTTDSALLQIFEQCPWNFRIILRRIREPKSANREFIQWDQRKPKAWPPECDWTRSRIRPS